MINKIFPKRNSKVSVDKSTPTLGAPIEEVPATGLLLKEFLRSCPDEALIVSVKGAVPCGSSSRRGSRLSFSSIYTDDYSSAFRTSARAFCELIGDCLSPLSSPPAANGKRSSFKRRRSAVQPEEPTTAPNNNNAAAPSANRGSFYDSNTNNGDRCCDRQEGEIRSAALAESPSLPTRSSLMISQPQRRRFSLSCSPISEERRAIRLRPAARVVVVVDSTTGQPRLPKGQDVTAAGAYGGASGVESYSFFTSRTFPGVRRRSAPSTPSMHNKLSSVFSHRPRYDDHSALSIRRRHADLSSGLIVSPPRSKGGVASGASSPPSSSMSVGAAAHAACVSGGGLSSSQPSSAAVGFGGAGTSSSSSASLGLGPTFLEEIEGKMATLALKSPFRGGEGASAQQQQQRNNGQTQQQQEQQAGGQRRKSSPPPPQARGLQLRFLVVEDPFYDGPKTKTVDTLMREGQIVAKANGEFECLRMVREAASKKVPFDVVLLDLDSLLASSTARCAKVIEALRKSLDFKGAIFCLLDVKLTTLRTMQKLISSGADSTVFKPLSIQALAEELTLMKSRASLRRQVRSSSNSSSLLLALQV